MSKVINFKKHYRYSLGDFWKYLEILEKALNGDLVLEVTPATTSNSVTTVNNEISANGKFTRDVVIKLKTVAGEVHEWFNGTFAISASATTTSGAIAIAGGLTEATFAEGQTTVTLEYTGTWASGETATLTVTGGSKLGYTISDATSVDTLTA
jgi:hypothetical protein